MNAVWQAGEARVQDVLAALKPRRLAYTTVLSAMQKLEKAGWLAHREEKRAYIYRAARPRVDEQRRSLRQFVGRVFQGQPLAAFQSLLDDARLTPQEFQELRRAIDRRRKELHDE